MKIQADGRVIDFEEKPKTPEKLERVRTEAGWLERLGLERGRPPYLASMGIYLFNRSLAGRPARVEHGHRFRPRAFAADDRQSPRPGPSVRRLLGRHRHGRGIPPGQYRSDRRQPGVRFRLRGRSDLHAAAVPALFADRRRDRQEQPDLRRHA